MIVTLLKFQVEHKGRLRVCQWEIEIGEELCRSPVDNHNDCHAMCLPAWASRPPGPTAGRHVSTPVST
jgi:hypothetical protein